MKKTALVTGANRGIGFEVVRQLAKAGMTVILGARDAQNGESAASELRAEGLDVHFGHLYTADLKSLTALRDRLKREYGQLDVLINNAGGNYDYGKTASTTDLDFLRQTLELNLVGTLRVIQTFLPLIEKSPSARIVNVSSGAGSHADKGFGLTTMQGGVFSYSVSKLALNGLTVKLATELQNRNILVNSVCPGFTATAPGMKEMGARPVEEGAASVTWAALLPDDGPRGGFFRDGKAIGW